MKPIGILALLLIALLTGCAPHSYHAAPISPAATAASFYSRSLDDPELRAGMKQQANFQTSSWPLEAWDLGVPTLAAYYFNPDLNVARAHRPARPQRVSVVDAEDGLSDDLLFRT
jgi:cobalt-zinc-cadmium efflux system outer membrane protein